MKEKGPPGCLQGPPQEMGGAQREGEQSKLQPKSRVVHFAFQNALHKLQENKETVSGYVTQQVNQIYDKSALSYLGLTKASWQRCDFFSMSNGPWITLRIPQNQSKPGRNSKRLCMMSVELVEHITFHFTPAVREVGSKYTVGQKGQIT